MAQDLRQKVLNTLSVWYHKACDIPSIHGPQYNYIPCHHVIQFIPPSKQTWCTLKNPKRILFVPSFIYFSHYRTIPKHNRQAGLKKWLKKKD